jgi:gliding motility-associated-like protein
MQKTCWTLIGILLTVSVHAQLAVLNNKGALIHANPNAIIKVKGSFLNDVNSTFTNHGTTTIDSTYTNNELSEGNGIYRVGKHWENNKNFVSDTSQVILIGDHQLITGDSISHFYTLELQNTGIKRQTLFSYTHHLLKLNDRELATDSFYMYVTNPALAAITRTTGFVSSLGDGRLSRHTNSTGIYLFPTGSSAGITRYRPVEMKPGLATDNYYAVRLVNNDASINGYDINDKDSAVCQVNPLFYHNINRNTGISDANISIYYDPVTDGNWDALAYWNHYGDPQWKDMGTVTNGTLVPFNFNTYNAWNQWQFVHYALSKKRPPIPQISGDTLVCGGYVLLYQGVSDQVNTSFIWDLTNGGTLIDSTVNPAYITWGAGNTNDTLQLIQVAANGCASFPAFQFIHVDPQPIAAFSATPTTALGAIPVVYTDSSQNAAYWAWNFGDGNTSTVTNPQHIYNGEGTYTTTLIVQTAEGCYDTAIAIINIIDGLHIPNVFTPNGDGANDIFEISGTNFKNFDAIIFDRWGVVVFESSAAQISWNGKTPTGSWASEGTYFLVLKITMLNGSVLDYSSFLNLFY